MPVESIAIRQVAPPPARHPAGMDASLLRRMTLGSSRARF